MQSCNTGTSLVQGTLSRFARDIWLSRLKEVAARSFLPIDLLHRPTAPAATVAAAASATATATATAAASAASAVYLSGVLGSAVVCMVV